MNPTVTIDRFEGDKAVLEVGGAFVDWPRSALPADAREGCRYTLTFADATADPAEANARLARLRSKTPQSGDIDL